MPDEQETLKPGAGVWFSQDGEVIIPIPPPSFFDKVPEDLSLEACAAHPFLQAGYVRVLCRNFPTVADYVEGSSVPNTSWIAALTWGAQIGRLLMDEGFAFIYQNYLLTKGTDGVELKRTLRRLPDFVKQHWIPEDVITVCLALGIDIDPVTMPWRELIEREKPQF